MQICRAVAQRLLEMSKGIKTSMPWVNVQNNQTARWAGRNANICQGPALPPSLDYRRLSGRVVESMGDQRNFTLQREYGKTRTRVGYGRFMECDSWSEDDFREARLWG